MSALSVYQRHATDVVNAIDYDYRGFDTLGEEYILFSSVPGVMLLLRDPKPAQSTAMNSTFVAPIISLVT